MRIFGISEPELVEFLDLSGSFKTLAQRSHCPDFFAGRWAFKELDFWGHSTASSRPSLARPGRFSAVQQYMRCADRSPRRRRCPWDHWIASIERKFRRMWIAWNSHDCCLNITRRCICICVVYVYACGAYLYMYVIGPRTSYTESKSTKLALSSDEKCRALMEICLHDFVVLTTRRLRQT